MLLKNPVTLPGIDPGTVRLVTQGFNHYTTPGPNLHPVPRLKTSGAKSPIPQFAFRVWTGATLIFYSPC